MTRLNLWNFVFETLERFQRAFMNHHIVTQQAHTGTAPRHTFGDQTAGDPTNPGNLKHFFDLRIADEVFANFGAEQAAGGGFNIINKIINHRVITDFNAFLIG